MLSRLLRSSAARLPAHVRFNSTASLSAAALQVHKTTSPKTKPQKETLVFGQTLSDHMLKCEWSKDGGWASPVIAPLENLSISPAALVLHYALECFEGMKAYRGVDGKVRLFRPELNIARLKKSSLRMALPDFDAEEFLKLLKQLVVLDNDWIPEGQGYSLYIRPTHIATQGSLGVGTTNRSLLYVLLSPVAAYYSTGFKPVSLLADPQFVRAWPGGTGDTKCGGNYAATIKPQQAAAEQGCQQVLWLFGPEENITEVGTMNLFIHWINEAGEEELVTAPLDGTILAGVTRQSVLDLCREWGEFKVTEKFMNMGQLTKALSEGRVREMFGSGTAATISPVGQILYKGEKLDIPLEHETAGPLAHRLTDAIFNIQYGVTPHDWAPVIA